MLTVRHKSDLSVTRNFNVDRMSIFIINSVIAFNLIYNLYLFKYPIKCFISIKQFRYS